MRANTKTQYWNWAIDAFESAIAHPYSRFPNPYWDHMWDELFNWAYLGGSHKPHEETPKRAKQKKLFLQSGCLYRLRANLTNFRDMYLTKGSEMYITSGKLLSQIEYQISLNKQQMKEL